MGSKQVCFAFHFTSLIMYPVVSYLPSRYQLPTITVSVFTTHWFSVLDQWIFCSMPL